MVKLVFCFGDSLTRWFDAETGGRRSHDDFGQSVLQKALGPGAHVIHKGLGSRTIMMIIPPIVTAIARGCCRRFCTAIRRRIYSSSC